MKQERLDVSTPAGGEYSIAYYKDADGNLVEKEDAVAMEIVEFDEEDEAIRRTYMTQE